MHIQWSIRNSNNATQTVTKTLQETLYEWELDLEIVNINKGFGWTKPSTLKIEEIRPIYLICIKQVLEETFDIKLYELLTEEDYLDEGKWTEAYDRNNLSRDSLNSDIRKCIQFRPKRETTMKIYTARIFKRRTYWEVFRWENRRYRVRKPESITELSHSARLHQK